MISLSIFGSVEFYVVAAAVAAAIVALSAMPSRRGAARTFLFEGTLCDDGKAGAEPSIEVCVLDDGTLRLRRHGLDGIHSSGAYSLAVQIIGFDVSINERLVPGRSAAVDDYAHEGEVVLNCFAAEHYHFQYISDITGRSCAFYLNISPGNRISRILTL